MKAVVKFFRHRAISKFLRRKKACILPDMYKYPSVAILLDRNQFERRREIEQLLTKLFNLKRFTFIVYTETLPKDVMQTDRYFFVTKNDFDFWGLIKQDKKESILCMSFDLVIDFTVKDDEMLTNPYILSLINNSFRMTFGNTSSKMYDMVIDAKKEDDMLKQIEILHNYLSMLLGKR